MMKDNLANCDTPILLYGPPGSGKSSAGRLLAETLELPFWDLDHEIELRSRAKIPEIFNTYGESGFRKREQDVLKSLLVRRHGVISLGGGALLDLGNRALANDSGFILCLSASTDDLINRLQTADEERPLLSENLESSLSALIAQRADHYASFPNQLDTSGRNSREIAWEAQKILGAFRIRGMGEPYDVRVIENGIHCVGSLIKSRGLRGPVGLVCDTNIAPLYADIVMDSLQAAGYQVKKIIIPAGEEHKTIATVHTIWAQLLAGKIERGSTIVALGGGVLGDLTGFAAATYLRGVRWVTVPTSLLAMVDASLGGKTGADLPEGKNLIGAFHSPRFVLADPLTLNTLPEAEFRSGLAEVVKHGVISDPGLFNFCDQGWKNIQANLGQLVRRGMAVKIQVIQSDPYEQGLRKKLNLGHTIGHAIETVSNYRVRHGEAVAIGMLLAAKLSIHAGVADESLVRQITQTLTKLGLPTSIPASLDRQKIIEATSFDKKQSGGKMQFTLPVRVGEVIYGVEVKDWEYIVGD
jgi:shikimate kinase/3-dehydroquinate synthase